MNWMDLLRMSSSNLKRRKLRTFLTVLGVMIGTTSIVVMISLGLGLQEAMYKEIEMSGGLNTISVTGADAGSSMVYYGDEGTEEKSDKRLTDAAVAELSKLEHVVSATPQYEMSVVLLKGGYEGWAELVALPPEALKALNLDLAEGGKLPQAGTSNLELVYGNGILTNFYEKGTGNGYYDTGELPDIDLKKDTIFLILDQDGYYSSQEAPSFGNEEGSDEAGSTSRKVQKHAVRASGVVSGDVDTWKTGYYNIYCDLDTLKQVLKKEFSGRAIPGQPTTKSGKPYKEFTYSSVQVKVDDTELVDQVVGEIRAMGYNASTNAEYMESAKKQMAMIQAVLGGIGAVSLLVAAIGIANTMMMSIYERTKEIGVIKVLGCSLKNIKQMFLMEAAFIGLIGGAAGMILSFLISAIINVLTGHGAAMGIEGNISYIPIWLVFAAMGFAMFVGTAAGYFPALRAMRLSPLAAIKTE
ncbi:MAG: ABC transporter permease [Eubacteriales bacterium]|nr:ABC transporter permease [Eubacteriales bacterium]